MICKELKPQPGPQTAFLETKADIAIYGGAAGGGKSFALLLEPLRHYNNSNFVGVIFRRNAKQVTNPGGLWDTAARMYSPMGSVPRLTNLSYEFMTRMKIQFGHLEYEKNVYDWQGSEIPYIGFDELTHFTEFQFFYMMSRNRSTSGVPGYIRATTNPDSRSWVRKLIDWWIDPETGLPIPERSGKIRWFIRKDDTLYFAGTRKELIERFGKEIPPKSLTFISAKLEDNKILMEQDPAYLANLLALPRVERMRLRDGNWNVEPTAGLLFQKQWFEIVDAVPAVGKTIRYWDRASTEAGKGKDPAYTAGLKLRRPSTGLLYVMDMVRGQWSPMKVQQTILNTAKQDGVSTIVGIEKDPGQAGVVEAQLYIRLLAGFNVKLYPAVIDKVTRAEPISAQSEQGNVKILRGPWNKAFLDELQAFPEGLKKDQVDALSGAFNLMMATNTGTFTEAMSQDKIETHAPSLKGDSQW